MRLGLLWIIVVWAAVALYQIYRDVESAPDDMLNTMQEHPNCCLIEPNHNLYYK